MFPGHEADTTQAYIRTLKAHVAAQRTTLGGFTYLCVHILLSVRGFVTRQPVKHALLAELACFTTHSDSLYNDSCNLELQIDWVPE